MKVLHLLASGGTGGIEVLCKNIIEKADWDNRICFLFEEGEIYEELKKRNVFSLKEENRNIKSIVNKLVNYCQREKVDIVTVHHGGIRCNLIYMMLKKRLPKIKYVRYLHSCFDKYSFGNDGNILKKILVKKIMQRAFNISDLLIFISKAVKTSFDNNFKIKDKNNVIIYNGIDEKFYEMPLLKRDKNGINNIIFVGRLSYVKGVDLLIDAFNQVQKTNSNVRLTIVGDGEEKQNLTKRTKQLGLQDKIYFAGRQANVIEWLDKADIFVYPSIWEEGFGISVVEAMARGCIPITFNKGGLPEIIKDGRNGFLVDTVNTDKLSGKIIELILKSNDEIKKVRDNAIETSTKFSINSTIVSLKNVYTKL